MSRIHIKIEIEICPKKIPTTPILKDFIKISGAGLLINVLNHFQ